MTYNVFTVVILVTKALLRKAARNEVRAVYNEGTQMAFSETHLVLLIAAV
jgi:hypothetical protein